MIKFYDIETEVGKGKVKTRALSKKDIARKIDNLTYRNVLTLEKNHRKIINEIIKHDDFIYSAKTQKKVKSLTISIEWKRSYTWGSNPSATAEIHYMDGSFSRVDGFTCSGYGYDKESTVIAQIFNNCLLYKLYELQGCPKKIEKIPYGAYVDFPKGWISFNGGVGTSCYYGLTEALGGKFERIASGKTYDCYQVTFKK